MRPNGDSTFVQSVSPSRSSVPYSTWIAANDGGAATRVPPCRSEDTRWVLLRTAIFNPDGPIERQKGKINEGGGDMFMLLRVAFYILTLLTGIIYLGAVVDLLRGYVGFLAYVLWIFVAPVLSPALLGLPWFDAWVSDSAVNERVFWIWAAWMVFLIAFFAAAGASELFGKLRRK